MVVYWECLCGSKIGEFAGKKLGGLIGANFAESTTKNATSFIPFDNVKTIVQKNVADAGKTIGASMGKPVGKTAGVVGGTYIGVKTGEYIEDKLANAIASNNHDSWFITMKKDNKQFYLTLNSKELVSDDPSKAAILSKKDGFTSNKDVQEKLAKDGVFEVLKDFNDIQVIGFEKSKIE